MSTYAERIDEGLCGRCAHEREDPVREVGGERQGKWEKSRLPARTTQPLLPTCLRK